MKIVAHLETLEKRHGDLEQKLHDVLLQPSSDRTVILELKRRKLQLKDQIQRIRTSIH